MPRRYDYREAAYRYTCLTPGCGSQVLTSGGPDTATRDDIDRLTGRPVAETFAYRGDGRGNAARCRQCERERRASRSAAGRTSGRVPGTHRVAADERTFGVEFEVLLPGYGASVNRDAVRAALAAEGVTGWSVKGDGSLNYEHGIEVVSPVLRGEAGHEQIVKVCRALRSAGATVNTSCGLHVHHGAQDLTVENIKQVARSWQRNSNLIDGLVAPSRRAAAAPYYCRPLSRSDMTRIESCSTLSQMKRAFGTSHYTDYRYRTLNLAAYGRYGTIEIRQHQGTINAEKVSSWIRFGQALIEAACSTTEPAMAPASRMRDLLAAMTAMHETARTFCLGRAVEFGHCEV